MSDSQTTSPWLSHQALACYLIVWIFIAYANVYQNQFLWDDEFLIDENQYITSFSNLGKIFSESSTSGFGTSDRFFRPMQAFAYTLAQAANGSNVSKQESTATNKKSPWPFHLLNVSLHAFNGLLFFYFILLLWPGAPWAFWAALLWGVHPVHTEAITYMSGTADPLSMLFGLASMILFVKQ